MNPLPRWLDWWSETLQIPEDAGELTHSEGMGALATWALICVMSAALFTMGEVLIGRGPALALWIFAVGASLLGLGGLVFLPKVSPPKAYLVALIATTLGAVWLLWADSELARVAWHLGLQPQGGLSHEAALIHLLPREVVPPFRPETLSMQAGLDVFLGLPPARWLGTLSHMSAATYWTGVAAVAGGGIIARRWWLWHYQHSSSDAAILVLGLGGAIAALSWPGSLYLLLFLMLGGATVLLQLGWWALLGIGVALLPPFWKSLNKTLDLVGQGIKQAACWTKKAVATFAQKDLKALMPAQWRPGELVGWLIGLVDRPIIWKLLWTQESLNQQQRQHLREWAWRDGNHRAITRYIQRARKHDYQDFLEVLADPEDIKLLYQRALGASTDQQFRRRFQELTQKSPKRAWELIQRLGGPGHARINSTELATLLNHASPRLRQQILRAMGQHPACQNLTP